MERRDRGRVLSVLVILIALGGLVILGAGTLRLGATPDVAIEPALPAIGARTPVHVKVDGQGRGFRHVKVEFVQGTRVELVAKKDYPAPATWSLSLPGTGRDELTVEIGRETIKGLSQLPATIRVTADRAGTWLRHPDPVTREIVLPVRLTPPTLQILSTATYVSQGGCETVVYRVGDTAVRHGVKAGDWFFPGFPVPGGTNGEHFALFAVPYNMSSASGVTLVASDDVGNQAQLSFIDSFTPDPPRSDTIELSDAFLHRVVPSILSQTPEMTDRGGLLANFLAINRELRKTDNAELRDLAKSTKPEFLWRRPFQAMRNAGVMARFADRRTYVYEGRRVDQQDHLGLDLARTEATPVPAANDGIVTLAKFLGIYGNTVVIDHGFGLMTLYGHLSTIDVREGQSVKQGDVIGRTGDTGLAGGDHLHFSILLQGLPVKPQEWVDGHWLRDRIARKLGPGFPLEGGVKS